MAISREATEARLETTATAMVAKLGSKSAVIRKLHADGMSTGDISRFMDIRFQHVRNVLTNPLKKAQ
jgi:transposase